MGNYRLNYKDIKNLANYLRQIGSKHIPANLPEWNEQAIMTIRDGDGAFQFVCDETYPDMPIEAIENLAKVIAEWWNW